MMLVLWIITVAGCMSHHVVEGSQYLVTEEMEFPSYSESDTDFLFCDFRSILRFQTERWTEMCSQCTCERTAVLCNRNRCPAFCRHRFRLLNDYCCQGCTLKGNVTEALEIGLTCPPSEWSFVERSHDEEWRLDGCTSCVCNNGTSSCKSETCCSQCPSIKFHRNET
ncbi:hypothetical protein HOLleu_40328 [Holothuria leucospilota]|uniref:Uncharacterized protein n=1 Tax=Holothuria leucospilota TaxID=206669 RepID=A0A9Q1BAF9_HOLLE|nr:hypothetical protein HOLleu_40328 [Holothuria leucospilota]